MRAVLTIPPASFRKSEHGFAATEFALIIPVLMALFLGGVSAFDANRASSAMSKASTTMVDLATRQSLMNDNLRDTLFETVEAIAGRYADADDFFIVMTSVSNPADDPEPDVQIDWSEATIPSEILDEEDLQDLNLPDLAEGESVVIVTLSATFDPMIDWDVVRPWKITRTSIRRPRFVPVVLYQD